MQLVLCFCCITVACGDIALAARLDLVRDLFAAGLLDCFYHVKNGISVSCTQVVDRYAGFLFQLLYRTHMADRQVNHMDVIAYARTVVCIVVIAEYTELLQFADGNLCNVWHQVVRDALRVLADQSALVCADRVEVS